MKFLNDIFNLVVKVTLFFFIVIFLTHLYETITDNYIEQVPYRVFEQIGTNKGANYELN